MFSTGRRIRGKTGQLIVKEWSETKVAFVTGKQVGKPVTRNLLRRRMREFYRTHKSLVPENHAVIFQLFPQPEIPTYQEIEEEFIELCSRL